MGPIWSIQQNRFQPQPPAMKFSLVAALAVGLALAQGSRAEAPDVEKVFEDLRLRLTKTAQELSDQIKTQDLVGQAQAFVQEGQAQLEPLAAQIQAQLKPLASDLQEQLKPLGDNLQAQLKPLVDNFQTQMQDIITKLMDQAKAIGQQSGYHGNSCHGAAGLPLAT